MAEQSTTETTARSLKATVHGLVAGHAADRPNAIAVQTAEQRLTYGELDTAARRVAAQLVAHGLRPGDLVLVSSPRTPALVVTLLAVLTAGGAYIAADHRWPLARLAQVAERSDLTLVVGSAAGAELPGTLLLPGSADQLGADHRPLATPPQVTGDDPFCVIFTSGSSGEPKGVLTRHGATALRIHDVGYADFDRETVTLQASPLPWDGLTFELWTALVNGGRVVLHNGEPLTPAAVRRARKRGVNTMFLTGSLLNSLVQDDVDALGGFRQLSTGGERGSVRSVQKFLRAHPDGRLLHLYGPAEVTMFATAVQVTLDQLEGLDDLPLGPALPATTITVRDESQRALPDGETGEIYIGGDGLALGYVGDPELTAARFVEVDGERCYRTGDLGWIDERGQLRFVGRRDRQIKLRGNRLELAEVEVAMRREPSVLEAHVVVRTTSTGVDCLVGHYTTVDGEERAAAIHDACVAALPAYAVPELRHHLRFPANINGKVDLRALKEFVPESAGLAGNPVLERLQLLVSEVRGLVPGTEDDLFEAGMDSLTAMRVAFRVSREFQVAFEAVDLYTQRSLAAVAELLPTLPALVGREPGGGLGPAQYEWWLREQLQPGDLAAVLARVFRITGDTPSEAALAAAAQDLADRHDLLRARFDYTTDGPRLVVAPRADIPLLTSDQPIDLDRGLPADWIRPFDLEAAPAWRVCLGRDGSGAALLCLVLHHWLLDGWSESLLVNDLGTALLSRERGAAPVWPHPAADSHAADGRRARQKPEAELRAFWAGLLDGTERLPVDPPSAPPAGPAMGRWSLRLAQDGLPEHAAAEDVQGAVLGAWGAALAAMGHRGSYPVGVAYAARDQVGEDVLGCHVQLLPLPLTALPDAGKGAAEIGAAWRAALRHSTLPLSEKLAAVSRDRRRRALQAVFVFQSNPQAELELGPRRQVERVELRTGAAMYALALEAWPTADGGLTLRLEWDRAAVDDGWAEALRDLLADALPAVGLRASADRGDRTK